jgi:hypothetical protein
MSLTVVRASTPAALKEFRRQQDYEQQDSGRLISAIFISKDNKNAYVKIQATEVWDKTKVIIDYNKYSTTLNQNIETLVHQFLCDPEYMLVQTQHQLSDGSTVRTTSRSPYS